MIKSIFGLFRFVINAMPMSWRYRLGDLIGFFINLLPLRENKVALYQIKKILRHPDCKQMTKKMFQSLCHTAIESMSIKEFIEKDAEIIFEDREKFKKLVEAPAGKLLLTGHFSNWELLAGVVATIYPNLRVIGRAARNPALDSELRRIRQSYGVTVLDKDDKATGFAVLKFLKKGGVVGALIDQDTEVASISVPFFDLPAKTPVALVDTALKTNSKIAAVFIERLAPAKFKIYFHDLSDLKNNLEVLTAYNNILEQHVIRHPEQWVWVHKRWRSTPDGKTLRTDQYLAYLNQL
jgi:KDO2-lipid IV(A) lauroyltransferase